MHTAVPHPRWPLAWGGPQLPPHCRAKALPQAATRDVQNDMEVTISCYVQSDPKNIPNTSWCQDPARPRQDPALRSPDCSKLVGSSSACHSTPPGAAPPTACSLLWVPPHTITPSPVHGLTADTAAPSSTQQPEALGNRHRNKCVKNPSPQEWELDTGVRWEGTPSPSPHSPPAQRTEAPGTRMPSHPGRWRAGRWDPLKQRPGAAVRSSHVRVLLPSTPLLSQAAGSRRR